MATTSSTLRRTRSAAGNAAAANELVPLVYDELRTMAANKMAQERPGQTLQATALVHEAYLRLAGNAQGWQNRAHFFGAAAEAMRRILIDNARRKRSGKHGGGLERIDLNSVDLAIRAADDHLLLVNEALEKLEAKDPEAAQLIKHVDQHQDAKENPGNPQEHPGKATRDVKAERHVATPGVWRDRRLGR